MIAKCIITHIMSIVIILGSAPVTFRKFSPISMIIGVIFAVILITYLSPVGPYGATLGIIGFVVGSGGSEVFLLFRRILKGRKVLGNAPNEGEDR